MTYSFDESKDLVKKGDIFCSTSFGGAQYLVLNVIDKKEDEFSFYGIEISLVGERWRLALKRDVFKERRQTIAPSPFEFKDTSFLRSTLKRVLEHDRPALLEV